MSHFRTLTFIILTLLLSACVTKEESVKRQTAPVNETADPVEGNQNSSTSSATFVLSPDFPSDKKVASIPANGTVFYVDYNNSSKYCFKATGDSDFTCYDETDGVPGRIYELVFNSNGLFRIVTKGGIAAPI